ncbi:MAG: hypothetical protein QF632_02645 [Candidatus Woesearchaeota archaeon]|jgi:hypothetical protein|nr:hypothetical protein [Candidatus Woesearchaeota archaeon]|tara:strand:+ start:49 stop:291 length:243 start_codon:yes stop_codon:yes gene_type:complete
MTEPEPKESSNSQWEELYRRLDERLKQTKRTMYLAAATITFTFIAYTMVCTSARSSLNPFDLYKKLTYNRSSSSDFQRRD